jgi:predicted regulator of Ras-like GTPase activity (Roadblock/LC7/MglB family)
MTSSAHTANPILQQFITMLSAMPEISNSVLVSKEGNLVYAAKTADAQISNFITYISVVSQQLQESMGMSGQQYTMLTLSSGSNLLILSGKEIVVGLKMSSTVPPGPVAAGLRPVLSRIRLQ